MSTFPKKVLNMKIEKKIGIVIFNNPKNSVNIINQDFSKDLEEVLDIYDKENLKAIIFKSSKKIIILLELILKC